MFLVSTGPHKDNVILDYFVIGTGDVSRAISRWCGEFGNKVKRDSIVIDFNKQVIHFDYCETFNDNYDCKAAWKLIKINRI